MFSFFCVNWGLSLCRKYYFNVMCGAHMFGQWSGDLECGVREVTRVVLMLILRIVIKYGSLARL